MPGRSRPSRALLPGLLLLGFSAAASGEPTGSETQAPGRAIERAERVESGRISWYGQELAGRRTASGEPYDPRGLTLAHPTLPFGTRVRITNRTNDRSVVLRVNDRGPFVHGRIADVSLAAARLLGMVRTAIVSAELRVVSAVGLIGAARDADRTASDRSDADAALPGETVTARVATWAAEEEGGDPASSAGDATRAADPESERP